MSARPRLISSQTGHEKEPSMSRAARRATPLAVLTIALFPAAAVHPQAPPKPSFPTQAETVTVDVVVTGKDGEPVLGLQRQDFSVKEDGAPQEIVAFDAVNRPAASGTTPAGGAPPTPRRAPPRTSASRDASRRAS